MVNDRKVIVHYNVSYVEYEIAKLSINLIYRLAKRSRAEVSFIIFSVKHPGK